MTSTPVPGSESLDVVTGAFGYTGRYIARMLLARGRRVRTLTAHPVREDPLAEQIEIAPFNFDRPAELARSLEGARCVINTYWVRFDYGGVTYEEAVENTRVLIEAARQARVTRFVHVSITNPSEDSPLRYFRGKAVIEREIRESGLGYTILRPTVIFGPEDILINNIAWLLRRFPVFMVPGDGNYRLQPVFVEDFAALAVGAADDIGNQTLDVAGPDIFTFNELVALLNAMVGRKPWVVHLSSSVALAFSRLVGLAMRDVLLTDDEIVGLMANLLVSQNPAAGRTRLGDWLSRNKEQIGISYASELARRKPSRFRT